MQYTLVSNSTQLEPRVDLAVATVVGPIRKLNGDNKGRVTCADPVPQTNDSQQKFSNVRLA